MGHAPGMPRPDISTHLPELKELMPALGTREQTAEALNVTLRTVNRYIADGRLRVLRLGRLVRIRRLDVEALLHEAGA